MDQAKLSAIQTELKSVKALFASVERDNIALDERIAVGDRSQRSIGSYLWGLFIFFTTSIIIAFILIVEISQITRLNDPQHAPPSRDPALIGFGTWYAN